MVWFGLAGFVGFGVVGSLGWCGGFAGLVGIRMPQSPWHAAAKRPRGQGRAPAAASAWQSAPRLPCWADLAAWALQGLHPSPIPRETHPLTGAVLFFFWGGGECICRGCVCLFLFGGGSCGANRGMTNDLSLVGPYGGHNLLGWIDVHQSKKGVPRSKSEDASLKLGNPRGSCADLMGGGLGRK